MLKQRKSFHNTTAAAIPVSQNLRRQEIPKDIIELYDDSLELMIPGMSEQEVAFCQESIAAMESDIQPSSVSIDGKSYYTYERPDGILCIIPMEVR